MSAAEMNMVTEKSRKRREKNRQEQNEVRNEDVEETGRSFSSTTSCMERGNNRSDKQKQFEKQSTNRCRTTETKSSQSEKEYQ